MVNGSWLKHAWPGPRGRLGGGWGGGRRGGGESSKLQSFKVLKFRSTGQKIKEFGTRIFKKQKQTIFWIIKFIKHVSGKELFYLFEIVLHKIRDPNSKVWSRFGNFGKCHIGNHPQALTCHFKPIINHKNSIIKPENSPKT